MLIALVSAGAGTVLSGPTNNLPYNWILCTLDYRKHRLASYLQKQDETKFFNNEVESPARLDEELIQVADSSALAGSTLCLRPTGESSRRPRRHPG